VVPASRGDDAGRLGVGALQPVDVGDPAAHLECAGRAVVLLFDPDFTAHTRRKERPGVLRCGRHVAMHERRGVVEFVGCEVGHRGLRFRADPITAGGQGQSELLAIHRHRTCSRHPRPGRHQRLRRLGRRLATLAQVNCPTGPDLPPSRGQEIAISQSAPTSYADRPLRTVAFPMHFATVRHLGGANGDFRSGFLGDGRARARCHLRAVPCDQ